MDRVGRDILTSCSDRLKLEDIVRGWEVSANEFLRGREQGGLLDALLVDLPMPFNVVHGP